MKRDHVLDKLSAYVDGEAKYPDQIAGHLQTCEDCARRHMELLRLSSGLRALPGPGTQEAFVTRVMARVAETDAPARRRHPLLSAPALAFQLAALLLLCAGGYWLLSETAPAPRIAIAENPRWGNDDAVVEEFSRLLDEGADLGLFAVVDDEVRTEEADEEIEVFEAFVELAANTAWTEPLTEDLIGEDDLYGMIGSLNDETTALLHELLYEYMEDPVGVFEENLHAEESWS